MASLWVKVGEGGLVPLDVEGYAREKDFQELLAANPEVLAGVLDGPEAQWLLIDRELPIKAEESDVGSWSLDHLFVAADGRPVLAEVKRSSDPRARREVVAQMLDYAASFSVEWSADRVRQRRTTRKGVVPSQQTEEMERFLAAGASDDEEQFWGEVQTKIDAGEIRLLFVADRPARIDDVSALDGPRRGLRRIVHRGVPAVAQLDGDELVLADGRRIAGIDASYLPPTANPSKLICVHLNSHQRSAEFGDHVGSRRGFGRVPMTCRNASGCCQHRRERRGP